jgi:hypothetical protein
MNERARRVPGTPVVGLIDQRPLEQGPVESLEKARARGLVKRIGKVLEQISVDEGGGVRRLKDPDALERVIDDLKKGKQVIDEIAIPQEVRESAESLTGKEEIPLLRELKRLSPDQSSVVWVFSIDPRSEQSISILETEAKVFAGLLAEADKDDNILAISKIRARFKEVANKVEPPERMRSYEPNI